MDTSAEWVGVHQSVIVTVFLSYLLNFTMQWMARQSKQQKITYRIRNLHFKVFLYGLGSLFGCNLLQGGIFTALLAWGVWLCLVVLHYLNFKDTDAKKRAVADIVYYALLIAWYVGVMVNYAIPK